MKPPKEFVNELKRVLENADAPERLDAHPWTESLVVQEAHATAPTPAARRPGRRLLLALAGLFSELRPSRPPRRGKRLDTRWGEFGLLAALYFAPFETGTIRPRSLRDACGRIDPAIALFVFGASADSVAESELEGYLLVSGEPEAFPASTLSDWHVQGLTRLAEILLRREADLSVRSGQPPRLGAGHENGREADPRPIAPTGETPDALALAPHVSMELPLEQCGVVPLPHAATPRSTPSAPRRFAVFARHRTRLAWAALVLALGMAGTLKILRLSQSFQQVRSDFARVAEGLGPDSTIDDLIAAAPALEATRQNLTALQAEAGPLLWLAPWLSGVPGYGPDLAQAPLLLEWAEAFAAGADDAANGLAPLGESLRAGAVSSSEIARILAQGQPRFRAAEGALARAQVARDSLDGLALSPAARAAVEATDAGRALVDEAVTLGLLVPELLGAERPRTYLLLAQDEAERRATGGFITAAGTVTFAGGRVVGWKFEDSFAVDDPAKPYFYAPEPLRRYMAAEIWLLRDVNWSPDFPTTARMAEALYAYTRPGPIDGVIAFDGEALRLLLEAAGPVEVEWGGRQERVSAENLQDRLRASWSPPPGLGTDPARPDTFVGQIAAALLVRLNDVNASLPWISLGRALRRALDERHLLVYLNDSPAREALSRRGWDGAVAPGEGDFLLVLDSNLGFNKADAAVEVSLDYRIDLSVPSGPTGTLTVHHASAAPAASAECRQAPAVDARRYGELTLGCYWDYLRVYLPEGTRLLEATPHAVPAGWMLLGQAVPARVDRLEQEGGAQGFGTLLVLPAGEALDTRFQWALPATVANGAGGVSSYVLRIQKQPGTEAVPLDLWIRLPEGSQFLSGTPAGKFQGGEWRVRLALGQDTTVAISFR